MRYQSPPAELFKLNRKRLFAELLDGQAAIFLSNDILPTNGDGVLPFIQNSDFYYLTGIDQEESILILSKAAGQEKVSLFIKKTNETIAIWEGHKLSIEEAQTISGINHVEWLTGFEKSENRIIHKGLAIGFNENDHLRSSTQTETREARHWRKFRHNNRKVKLFSIAKTIHELRVIKSEFEVEQLKKAIAITKIGYLAAIEAVKPGVKENEIEGLLSYKFLANGSRRFAYSPIIAGGKNSCVLHYIDNNATLQDGQIVLLDIGAEYGNYNADLTRVLPVNGKFTARQKEVYNAVLAVLKFATSILKPGLSFADYNQQVGRFMSEQLVALKLITEKDHNNASLSPPAYRRYFMHGTSHFLGLDVHDVGTYDTIQAGMVLTCEPGIYIPKEEIGIRLENDLYISESGAVNLMEDFPIEVEEIEALMK